MTDKKDRLKDLEAYYIMDTLPEEDLNELAEIASAICETPISLISLLDDSRQWFKAVKGLKVRETPIEQAFCKFTLDHPEEVLVVEDSWLDERFKDNALVVGDPNIRFYAGAPLVTPLGNVLGTLCIIDRKPRHISEHQKKALQLLAKKVMDFLNSRKLTIEQAKTIKFNAKRLQRLTDQVPAIIFQYEIATNLQQSITFVNEEINNIDLNINFQDVWTDPRLLLKVIHEDDVEAIKNSLYNLSKYTSVWQEEFRIIDANHKIIWFKGVAKREVRNDRTIVWYGILQDISIQKEYEQTIEQISFDISHVLRKPICTMLGLTQLIKNEEMNAQSLKDYSKYIELVSTELDIFTKKLYDTYHNKKKRIHTILNTENT
ncbi:GAF domain-containing protein [Aquimarina sp. U1-2]|uniref:GAF domain-containing protein n=1 Tax=Aquimarina sp. U1-2 TaxID=2823141 RepID=UPI001AECD23F|nr:GAF domain-containing protein [Aquimarina sp. U1-2]MBP2832997.1 GAF domain-containing protein [Aquimarina sp. U1-2]